MSIKLAVLHASKWLRLFALARYLTRHGVRILAYHGFQLRDECAFRPKLFMSAVTFAERMRTIQRLGLQVIALSELVAMLRSGNDLGARVVITIDDGFFGVYRDALPVLKRFGFPATVYVTSYYVQKGTPVFRLAVQYLFWRSRRTRLVLRDCAWAKDEEVDLSDSRQRERVMWQAIRHGESECDEPQRQQLAAQLGDLLDVSYQEVCSQRMFCLMSPRELGELRASPLDVQLHTHRHVFPADDRERAVAEVEENRSMLAPIAASALQHFCYPSGAWDPIQLPWLAATGIASATTCEAGLTFAGAQPLALSRFLDGEDVHAIEFEAELCGFLELARWMRKTLRRGDPARGVVTVEA